jgi:hypothetical protein
MLKSTIRAAICLAFACSVSVFAGCEADFDDCSVRCDEAESQCKQRCTDDVCATRCETELDDCVASCDEIETETESLQTLDGGL